MNVRLKVEMGSLRARFSRFPAFFRRGEQKTMQASLLTAWEETPGYPPEPPDSTYTRTGMLGRSLGVSEGGGTMGRPDIYEIRELGGGLEGSYGTQQTYAPHVIGAAATQQAWMHKGRWWTLPETVVARAKPKIERLWLVFVEEMARFLNGS